MIGFGAILVLSAFFVMSLKKNWKSRLTVPFIIFLFIGLDFSVFFVGGLNTSQALLMFLVLCAALLMVRKKQRLLIVSFAALNLLALIVLEYLYPSIRVINTNMSEVLLSSHIVIALTFTVGAFMIILFVNSFDQANELIIRQNELLERKAQEVEEQNLKLREQTSEILQQQAVIEHKNQELVQQSEDKFYQIFETTPNAITISRLADGVLLDANKSVTELLGYERKELLGKSSLELDLFADPKEREYLANTLIDAGEVLYRRFMFRRKDETTGHAVYSARIIELASTQCILFIAEDVTSRLRTEAALKESFQKIESFARKNSHEVRAPLTRLMGLIEVLRTTDDEKERLFMLDEIDKSAKDLDSIVHEINLILETTRA